MDTPTATTPSPPSHLHTPPTPKHGYSDSWEPYSPRKSARLSSQQQQTSAARTPSPNSSTKRQQQHPRSPQSSRRDLNAMSPASSPKKKRFPAVDSLRRASGQLTEESTAHAAASLGLQGKTESRQNRAAAGGMLPTPAKTPSRKQPSAQNEANIAAIARNLFHGEEDVLPSYTTPTTANKKKRAKKYTGFSMDSFAVIEDEEPIQIFTDTRERIPEVDKSVENPFYGHGAAAAPEPIKRRSKRKQISVPGEGTQTVEEAIHRDDGLVYVFRGKKIFRKFENEAESAESDVAIEDSESSQPKHFTRSSIKPRLLFPTKAKAPEELDEEEAMTDIEEQLHDDQDELPHTPAKLAGKIPNTPEAPKFAPASPPSTMRATRSGHKAADDLTPVKISSGGSKRSPFDDWRRSKSSSAGSGHKRSAGDMGSVGPSKRARTSNAL